MRNEIPSDDLRFILLRYFDGQTPTACNVTKHEYYLQRKLISDLFGYRLWSYHFLPELINRLKLSAKRDAAPSFIAREILDALKNQKIVRPGYSTLQKIISQAFKEEKSRLKCIIKSHLTEDHKQSLKQLIQKENTLLELAALKQDARSFKASVMAFYAQTVQNSEERKLNTKVR